MLNRLLKLFVVINSCLFISAARAELKVDIIAGGVDPISIAVQRFETDGKVNKKMPKWFAASWKMI